MNKKTSVTFRHFACSRETFERGIKPSIFKDFSTANIRDFIAIEMTTDLRKNDMFLCV